MNGHPIYQQDALNHAMDEVKTFFHTVERRTYAPHPTNLMLEMKLELD